MNSNILICNQLCKSFRRNHHTIHVLRNVDLTVNPGEITIILGKSGAGKSVLISLLAGLLKPDAGSINYKEFQISTLSNSALAQLRLSDIGVIFQNHNLLSSWTALENVMVCSFNTNGKLSATKPQAIKLLRQLGLESRMNHFPYEMSMGEQQRVAIARLLMATPELILADEPTGDVDPDTAQEIIKYLVAIVKEHQSGLLVTTHGHFPLDIADHVFELRNGRLVRV